ncbi:SMC-Scp complex subunit ScpB [Ligilactobacillus equi]|uniref:Segregation and condensation protein B n=2 Tax=Ligilactobacillus equi TaxID=137357 RepID=V7HVV7_9LACO|nr:SMC-Scp complex subunit ScpB [Ligilactobacillus equi]ETA73186.1 segregation and condensation protein B [Ligilactobacillus equi DPC 6820]KRL81362.1 segregation and condensation protein B [Ligilactobacillus equi DSM 15833 = JCM 10991]MCQ2557013.1 SMC-Scp complex subunit ScpB [Ligilactobacillus sp.]
MLSNQAKVESLLFVSGSEGISASQLAQLVGLMKPAVLSQIEKLQEKYKQDTSCSFEILQTGENFKLVTKKGFAPLVRHYFEQPTTTNLTPAALETLAIIAYEQPVTRVAIDEIRGVSSSGMIQKLLLLNLIKEDGRLDVIGRPILYATTQEFLDYFGLKSVADLPELPKEVEGGDEKRTEGEFLELFQQTLDEEATEE